MQVFLEQLQLTYPDDLIVLVCDGATWHKSGNLHIPEYITLLNIPPYTPEMNPIEQIWRELRSQGFRNEVFSSLEKVVNRLSVFADGLLFFLAQTEIWQWVVSATIVFEFHRVILRFLLQKEKAAIILKDSLQAITV